MESQQTHITTLPYMQGNPGTEAILKLFALYLQGVTVVQVAR